MAQTLFQWQYRTCSCSSAARTRTATARAFPGRTALARATDPSATSVMVERAACEEEIGASVSCCPARSRLQPVCSWAGPTGCVHGERNPVGRELRPLGAAVAATLLLRGGMFLRPGRFRPAELGDRGAEQ